MLAEGRRMMPASALEQVADLFAGSDMIDVLPRSLVAQSCPRRTSVSLHPG